MTKSLENKYESVSNRLKKISNELMSFEKENVDILKKYDELQNKKNKIYGEYRAIHKQVLIEKYNNCDHLMIKSYLECDYGYGGKNTVCCTCIKCGLDERVNHDYYGNLSEDEYEAMKTYFNKTHFGWFRNLSDKASSTEYCDGELAQAIYKKIKEVHPDIDDKTAIKYFEIALENMRENNITDEQKEKTAKRLSLRRNFNKWNEDDVITRYN